MAVMRRVNTKVFSDNEMPSLAATSREQRIKYDCTHTNNMRGSEMSHFNIKQRAVHVQARCTRTIFPSEGTKLKFPNKNARRAHKPA